MNKENWGVHISHCCILHGCKYGDKDCPVKLGYVKQEYICEDCDYDGIESLEDINKKLVKDKIELVKDKIDWFINLNECPYCRNNEDKRILDETNINFTEIECNNCQRKYKVIYKRIAVDLILD